MQTKGNGSPHLHGECDAAASILDWKAGGERNWSVKKALTHCSNTHTPQPDTGKGRECGNAPTKFSVVVERKVNRRRKDWTTRGGPEGYY